jgi:hypothetical protein
VHATSCSRREQVENVPAGTGVNFAFLENLDFRLISLKAMQSQSSISIKDTNGRCALKLDVAADVSAGKLIGAVE